MIRVLMAKTLLDSHNRGAIVVARALRDAGMEVIYVGNQTPDRIVATAIQEDVDVIAVSSMIGAHLAAFPEIRRLLEDNNAADILVIGGGFIPADDADSLKKTCGAEIFGVGAKTDDVVSYIRNTVKGRTGNVRN